MGKLHTLRRAIEREPDEWIQYGKACSAFRYTAGRPWEPCGYWTCGGKPYRSFVRAVLRSLGYVVN